MSFSRRTDWNTETSDLARAHRARLDAGLPLLDLTASNPTRCGFEYPSDLLAPLLDSAALDYDPNPKGSGQAREAICDYYTGHSADIDPENILLTTSTSEAYSYLFKLLCDPGDEIIVPVPGYPLFDYLADAEVVRLVTTPLIYDHGWQLDPDSIERSITSRTRAIVLVHPNNPTGHFTSREQARMLFDLCKLHDLALIVDEVFLDYALATDCVVSDALTFLARQPTVPTFVVSGISKILGLPQMKVAWIAAAGVGVEQAMVRLEVLADTFLSMNAPMQRALPVWLGQREQIQSQIRRRVRGNLDVLDQLLCAQPTPWVTRLEAEAGWYAVLRIPALCPDEATARELLERGVWVHPGYFFGMPTSGWLVVSLLTPDDTFAAGVRMVLDFVAERETAQQI
uniref:Aminotransferase n=1 Tax=mine drainage metagenome TaxID=410659 RepID=E6QJU7_9ZZZZ